MGGSIVARSLICDAHLVIRRTGSPATARMMQARQTTAALLMKRIVPSSHAAA